MAHPHEYLLQEYKLSIEKLVPLTPNEVIDEAKKLYDELLANESATERQIIQALIYIGRKEYPYRKAYEELCASDEEKRLNEAVITKLDAPLLDKIKPALQNGVHITDYAKSKLFEKDLTGEERYRVETAILDAHDVVGKQCDERAHERQQKFDDLVAIHRKDEERIQGLIDQLRSMADRDEKWRSEIIGKADEFEEGWSIVERDPSEEEVKQEIANWTGVFEEHPEGEVATEDGI
ncbi:MAG: hypothetical protein WC802_03580 [Patescibacteria group bacterium]